MLSKNLPKLYLLLNEDFSLTEFLDLLKKCPKDIELYIEIEGNWKYLHTSRGLKQIKNSIENFTVFFLTGDEIAKKMFQEFDLKLCEVIPEEVRDFYNEVMPDKKFLENKIGEAFSSQNFEVIEIMKEEAEEKVEALKAQVQNLPTKNKVFLSIVSLLCLVIFTFLIALVMPSAKVEIVSAKKNISTVVNMNFIKTDKDFSLRLEDKNNRFHLYPIELHFEDRFKFPVISKIFEGQNAEGSLKLYNSFAENITLRDGTRFQTESGLVFFTKHYVKVPARVEEVNEEGERVLVPGEAQVRVRASETDVYQEVIGSRGNISPQKLLIPGLTSYMQKFVWGENEVAFQGGTTRWRREVQQEDLDAAKDKMNSVLYAKAKEKLNMFIREKNLTLESKVTLFDLEKYIKNEISNITFAENILGTKMENFPVAGEMLISAYVYYHKDFHDFMKSHIEKKRDPKMKIEKIDFDSMTFRYFEETPQEIRIAVDLQGRQSYKITDKTLEGEEFQSSLRALISGMDTYAAEKILHNRPEISQLKIRIWPPFKKRLPLIHENIQVVEK